MPYYRVASAQALGYVLGTAFAGLGVLGLASPALAQQSFGVVLPTTPSYPADSGGKKPDRLISPATAYTLSKAGRDLVIGAMFIYLQKQGDNIGVAALMSILGTAGLVDGYAVWNSSSDKTVKSKAWPHCIGGVAFILLGWKIWVNLQ